MRISNFISDSLLTIVFSLSVCFCQFKLNSYYKYNDLFYWTIQWVGHNFTLRTIPAAECDPYIYYQRSILIQIVGLNFYHFFSSDTLELRLAVNLIIPGISRPSLPFDQHKYYDSSFRHLRAFRAPVLFALPKLPRFIA